MQGKNTEWKASILKQMRIFVTLAIILVQSLFSSRLQSKSIKIRIYKTIIFLWFCMVVKIGL
jgi:hypothetical protein